MPKKVRARIQVYRAEILHCCNANILGERKFPRVSLRLSNRLSAYQRALLSLYFIVFHSFIILGVYDWATTSGMGLDSILASPPSADALRNGGRHKIVCDHDTMFHPMHGSIGLKVRHFHMGQ